MELELLRYNHDAESSQGLLAVNHDFNCYTLEDEYRSVKVSGETRIPEGRYEIKLRTETTEMTRRYRKKYPWFTYHLWLQNVPGFNWIYIHIGNHDRHSDGCILVADTAQNDPRNFRGEQWESAQAFERLYKLITKAMKEHERVFITIRSLWQ